MLEFLGWLFLMYLMIKSIGFFGRALAGTASFQDHMERKLEREQLNRDLRETVRKMREQTQKGVTKDG